MSCWDVAIDEDDVAELMAERDWYCARDILPAHSTVVMGALANGVKVIACRFPAIPGADRREWEALRQNGDWLPLIPAHRVHWWRRLNGYEKQRVHKLLSQEVGHASPF